MGMRRLLLAVAMLAYFSDTALSVVLYRETFPATPVDPLPEFKRANGNVVAAGAANRGQNVLDQGWDVIRSRQDIIQDVTIVLVDTDGDGVLDEINNGSQNSAAIFANSDTVPKGDDVGTIGNPANGGVNNNPFLPDNPIVVNPDTGVESLTYTDGILFASAGFHPFLYFTEEVPAGTQASDVNYVRWRGRNNPPRTADPADQRMHAALKVDGQWYVSETGLVDPDSSQFKIGQIDLSGGNWALMDVVQLDRTDFDPLFEVAELAGGFDQSKPAGNVEAWGIYQPLLTNNTRFDYIEFGTDLVTTSIPEPASVTLLALGAVALAARRRRRVKDAG